MKKQQYEIKRLSNGGMIAIKESRGNIYAVTYSPDMTVEMVKESIKRNPPQRNEWKPYNQTFGAYCNG